MSDRDDALIDAIMLRRHFAIIIEMSQKASQAIESFGRGEMSVVEVAQMLRQESGILRVTLQNLLTQLPQHSELARDKRSAP